MAEPSTTARQAFGDIAPDLARYTDTLLFDEVWARPGLSQRDRCMVTITCLIALYRGNELGFHLRKALDTGVTREEIIEIITHLAFYSGWPTASSALALARQIFEDRKDAAS
ncbi:carboxymuconolactone decarboxylase family protein [Asaia sp. W19]|uniref:carboxymuconolactone decarboxylase family protein n=1 Tax=unclassified Asaia TaxID=2685023 RepID=UPI000F8EF929|nr:carboxymuconolactone decarboxylase family protein [Asaia sp. W19]RUT24763.1 carboxymuconolactone decarboxylase family protein [Asaia sp. W19]